jgi:peptidylprolyl isomerase
MPPVKGRILIFAVGAALALGLAACGDDDDDSTVEDATTTEASAPAEGSASGADNTDLSKKPVIETTGDESPGALIVNDIVEGKGPEAKTGDDVSMQYVGVLYSDGTEFDASWDRGEPFDFKLGGGEVIPGWDQGIVGMKVGGRRELVIPPDLAYGPAGQPPTIPPDATLVFIVDLLEVTPG